MIDGACKRNLITQPTVNVGLSRANTPQLGT